MFKRESRSDKLYVGISFCEPKKEPAFAVDEDAPLLRCELDFPDVSEMSRSKILAECSKSKRVAAATFLMAIRRLGASIDQLDPAVLEEMLVLYASAGIKLAGAVLQDAPKNDGKIHVVAGLLRQRPMIPGIAVFEPHSGPCEDVFGGITEYSVSTVFRRKLPSFGLSAGVFCHQRSSPREFGFVITPEHTLKSGDVIKIVATRVETRHGRYPLFKLSLFKNGEYLDSRDVPFCSYVRYSLRPNHVSFDCYTGHLPTGDFTVSCSGSECVNYTLTMSADSYRDADPCLERLEIK